MMHRLTLASSALARARSVFPHGVIFLVRIGSPGAFKISRRASNAYPGHI